MRYNQSMFRFIKNKNLEKYFLKDNFVFLDLGARGGLGYPWTQVPPSKLITYLFEPENIEFLELSKSNLISNNVVNVGISNKDATSDLFITMEPGCSSTLKPNDRILNEFNLSTNWDIRDIIKIRTQRLDTFLNSNEIDPDAIKIDVQGLSLQVIEGMGEKLHNFLLIEAECEFRQLYQNQSLFHDVSKLLHDKGYILLDLKRYWANGKNIPIHNRAQGQIVFCDAVWVIGPSKFFELIGMDILNKEKIYKVIYGLIMYGFYDVALNFINHKDSYLSLDERDKFTALVFDYCKKKFNPTFSNYFLLKMINPLSFILENISNNLKMDKSSIGWSSDLRRRNYSLMRIFYDKFSKN
jgi:FkbM family methyltransferase